MEKTLKAMRNMAWERAKGEINAMLVTYYIAEDGDSFNLFKKEFDNFVAKVEGEGWQE